MIKELEDWCGKPLTAGRKREIEEKMNATKSRVIKPNSMSTCDYWPDRVNIHIDEEGTILDIKMG